MSCKCTNCLKDARAKRREQLVNLFCIAFLIGMVIGAVLPALGF